MDTPLSRIDLLLDDSLRYRVNILWLNAGKDLIAFVEIHPNIAIVRENRPKLEIALNGESEFIHGALEDFHRDPGWEGIDAQWIGAMDTDFFRSEGEKNFSGGLRALLADL